MIVCFGTLCLDRVHRVQKMPRAGGYVEAFESQCFLGGEAANTALALSALAISTRLVSNPIGDDESGRLVADLAQYHGLALPRIVSGYATPVTDIYVTPDGERTMFGAGFSAMDTADLPLPDVSDATWLTAEPNMPNASKCAVQHAQHENVQTYLMDFVSPEHEEVVSRCDVWQSSTDWVGERGDADENLRWVEEHCRRFGCTTILTDGPRGMFAASRDLGARSFPSFPCPDAIDSTGAGDVFRAGVIAGLVQSLPFNRCLMAGAAAACIAAKSLGASASLPRRDQIEQLIAENELVAQAYV